MLSFLTFCVIVGAIVASMTVFLKVAEIKVTGVEKYDVNDIIATSGIKNGDNLFWVNKFDVASKICAEYPYIESIKIRRKLPDTFIFEVTERVPCGYIEKDGKKWLIDSNAYVIEMMPDGYSSSLPEITGGTMLTPSSGSALVLENKEQLPALQELLTAIRSGGMIEKISRIEIDKLYDLKVIYQDRFLVNLGDSLKLTKKIEMLKVVVAELGEEEKGTINVSKIKEARYRPDLGIDLSKDRDDKKDREAETVEPDETKSEDVESDASGTEKTATSDAVA